MTSERRTRLASRPCRIPIRCASGCPVLSSVRRAAETPGRLSDFWPLSVLGAGPNGVELAGAISDLTRYSRPQEYRCIRPEEARIVVHLFRVIGLCDRILAYIQWVSAWLFHARGARLNDSELNGLLQAR